MLIRQLAPKLQQLAKKFPLLAITGPRQAGKTTLAQLVFSQKKYVSLEDLDQREYAMNDPRGFLMHYQEGAIIDEVQRVPELFSYLQTHVDKIGKAGQFILTGSQNFLLLDKINQSLAGRIAITKLLPLSLQELNLNNIRLTTPEASIFSGFYPGLYQRDIPPQDWYPSYIQTYLERDVRQIKNIVDLSQFQTFLKMCANRVGQLLNLSSLANDCGITHNTAKAWLSLLEASYIVFLLRPHHQNFNKRLVKMPKLYFYDTGILSSLLGIQTVEQLNNHYAKGALFENLILLEIIKSRYNHGLIQDLYFWRDNHGHEVDCIIETASKLVAVEIKSGKTIVGDFFAGLAYWQALTAKKIKSYLVYGGDVSQMRQTIDVMSWKQLKAPLIAEG